MRHYTKLKRSLCRGYPRNELWYFSSKLFSLTMPYSGLCRVNASTLFMYPSILMQKDHTVMRESECSYIGVFFFFTICLYDGPRLK